MKTVEFAYDIGDTVHVADYPDIRGHVVGLCVRVWGTTYCVCWWQDGKRLEEWLHDWELEPMKSKKSNAQIEGRRE